MNPESPAPAPAPNLGQPGQPSQPSPSGQPSNLQLTANRFGDVFGAVFSWLIFPIIIVFILHFFIFQAYHVVGTSMVQTLQNSDYLIVSKLGDTEAQIGRTFGHKNDLYIPQRDQIIVFHFPLDPTKIFVKRVIGLPGDRVVVKSGKVTVYNAAHPNGFDPNTGYEPAGTVTLIDTDVTVKPGNVFVMGDNRSNGGSYDSRQWGQVPSANIIGDVVLRLLPLDQIKTF
jgi:signal peptidase I